MTDKIDKPVAKLTKKKRKKAELTNLRNETMAVTRDPININRTT